MNIGLKHICAVTAFSLVVAQASATPFTHSQALPVWSGYTAWPLWISNGYNDTGTTCKVIVVGSHYISGNSPTACFWVVTMNSSGYVSATSETEMPDMGTSSHARGVNDNGDVCGDGYIPNNTTPYAFVWENHGTASAPSYGTYNSQTQTWSHYPYALTLNNGHPQIGQSINNSYTCGYTFNSTGGWYESLSSLFANSDTGGVGVTTLSAAPMDYCLSINPDTTKNTIGGIGNVLRWNHNVMNDYDTSATTIPQVSWWDGIVTLHSFEVNAVRNNGSNEAVAGRIGVSNGRILACYSGNYNTAASVLSGNSTVQGAQNLTTAMNIDLLAVGYLPYNAGLDDNWAWYSSVGGAISKIDLDSFTCVNDSGSYHRPVMACGLNTSGNGAIFW